MWTFKYLKIHTYYNQNIYYDLRLLLQIVSDIYTVGLCKSI